MIAAARLDEITDVEQVQRATRVTMAVSITVHVLLLAWLLLHRVAPVVQQSLTEITLLEGSEASDPAAGAPSVVRVAVPEPGTLAPASQDVHFRRESHAAVQPSPQSDVALDDRIQSRLAALQQTPSLASVPGALGGPAIAESPTLAGVGGSGSAAPLTLHRGGGSGDAPSLSLTRGGSGTGAPSLAVASGALAAPPEAHEAASEGNASAHRSLAGAMLAGPIADRPVRSMVPPVYPEWAKRDAVEGSVTLYFVVRPDGTVKENVLVQKTAGFQDFDENAQAALRKWLFEPLHGGRTGEQWGTITFRFRLRESN